VYCNEPWLLHSAKLVYFFGGANDSDYNVPLSGLVVGHSCMYDWSFHFFNIIEYAHFMHMLLLYFRYLGYSNDICICCLRMYVWIFLYMFVGILSTCVVGLTMTLDRWLSFFLACDVSLSCVPFQVV